VASTHIEISSLTIASKKPEGLLEVMQLRKTHKEIELELEILKKSCSYLLIHSFSIFN